MLGLPMELIVPVLGFGAIIFSIVAGVVTVRLVGAKIRQQELRAQGMDADERDRLLEDVHGRLAEIDQLTQRLGELEERVDFSERLLTQTREGLRLEPPKG